MDINKENLKLKKIILLIRNLFREKILMSGDIPVKNTSRKDCYRMLTMLQEFFKSNTLLSDEEFLKQILGE